MKACHVVTSISRAAAGVSKAVIDLSEALAVDGTAGRVVTLSDEFTEMDLPAIHIPVDVCRRSLFPGLSFSFELKKQIIQNRDIDIIHSHGLWMYPNFAAGNVARKQRLPHVVSPHGMLEPWALQRSVFKKKLVWHLFQKNELRQADLLHATALPEAQHFRELGLKNPIAIIPNGVNLPLAAEKFGGEAREKTFLFLSRIHPKKGLLNLVQAWEMLKPQGWRVIIAGPDEDNHLAQVQSCIREAGLEEYFEFVGPVYEDQKWDAYRSADVFVLPSFSENFGIVIAEALAAGIPVITTKATPWRELTDHNCGWWIDVGIGPLVQAMAEAVATSDRERQAMGLRGRELIQDAYSWGKIASDMSATYEWVLGGGAPPSCVLTD